MSHFICYLYAATNTSFFSDGQSAKKIRTILKFEPAHSLTIHTSLSSVARDSHFSGQ